MSEHISGAAQGGPTPSHHDQRSDLARAIDELALSCPGLARGLGMDCLPHTASLAEGLKHYGGPSGEWTAKFSLWFHWRNGMRVAAAWDAWIDRSLAAEPGSGAPAVVDEPVGPDEAVGKPAGENDGADDQLSLGRA